MDVLRINRPIFGMRGKSGRPWSGGKGNRPATYSDAIGNGLGDAGQGLLGFQVSQNQPSLFGYFFGDGKSIVHLTFIWLTCPIPTLPVPRQRNTPPYSWREPFLVKILRKRPVLEGKINQVGYGLDEKYT
ncbi:hypothetical protein DZC72_05310 [Maribacter algicola]|uniref:Uncharacterized protein n=1 Tax=Maribacter algicola TaxID=2498892 RepID=A0A426RM20_9FLAO|nr:hypothetical protein DZC72_05310 [Maribacter algicola]